jgi:FtsH-binding integral membrane protein
VDVHTSAFAMVLLAAFFLLCLGTLGLVLLVLDASSSTWSRGVIWSLTASVSTTCLGHISLHGWITSGDVEEEMGRCLQVHRTVLKKSDETVEWLHLVLRSQ